MTFEGTKEKVKRGELNPQDVIKELRAKRARGEHISESLLSWLRGAGTKRYEEALSKKQ